MAKKIKKQKVKIDKKVKNGLILKALENEEKKFLTRLKRVKSRAITDIITHIKIKSDVFVDYGNWYCGITKDKDAMKRIKRHMKDKKTPALYPIVRTALTMENANLIEAHFSIMGMTNAPHKEGAKPESIYVYAFKRHLNFIESMAHLLS